VPNPRSGSATASIDVGNGFSIDAGAAVPTAVPDARAGPGDFM
jgi:hypothetical protein